MKKEAPSLSAALQPPKGYFVGLLFAKGKKGA
jgi:hypothetical protein